MRHVYGSRKDVPSDPEPTIVVHAVAYLDENGNVLHTAKLPARAPLWPGDQLTVTVNYGKLGDLHIPSAWYKEP